MSQIIEINIDNETANFVLTGNIGEIQSNTRFVFSLKRLKYLVEENRILIRSESVV